MRENGWGRIINVSGLAARSDRLDPGSVRNVAVAALTKNLADELGPNGINVTVVHPGFTRTEKTAGMLADRAASGGDPRPRWSGRGANILIGRMVEAEEVATWSRSWPRPAAWRSMATPSPAAAARSARSTTKPAANPGAGPTAPGRLSGRVHAEAGHERSLLVGRGRFGAVPEFVQTGEVGVHRRGVDDQQPGGLGAGVAKGVSGAARNKHEPLAPEEWQPRQLHRQQQPP